MKTEVISIIITCISILCTIKFGIGRKKACDEVKKYRDYFKFKKTEEFSIRYRDELKSYTKRITRPKWKEQIQGRDLIGDIDILLTDFNTYMPNFDSFRRKQLSNAIDEAKKEFIKVRTGDEYVRDSNLTHLNNIDRLLNEELVEQGKKFIELL